MLFALFTTAYRLLKCIISWYIRWNKNLTNMSSHQSALSAIKLLLRMEIKQFSLEQELECLLMITEVNKDRQWECRVFKEIPADHVHCALTLLLPFPEVLQVTSHKWITEQLNVLEWVLQCVKTQRPLLGWVSECKFCC